MGSPTFAEVRAIIEVVTDKIDQYAGGNPAFDAQKERAKQESRIIVEGELGGLRSFVVKTGLPTGRLGEDYRVILNKDAEVIVLEQIKL